MTLKGYYESLPASTNPKTQFVNEIIRRTGVSSATARNWIYYGMKPSNPNHVKILTEITGIEEEDLWKD